MFLNQETFPIYHEWIPARGNRNSASKVCSYKPVLLFSESQPLCMAVAS